MLAAIRFVVSQWLRMQTWGRMMWMSEYAVELS